VRDVQLEESLPRLLIWQTKFRKSRWVPLHPTVVDRLRHYARLRHELHYDGFSDIFFISEQGGSLDLNTLDRTFRRLLRRLAIHAQPGHRAPSLTSFRHTFAVNRVRQWYEAGVDVQAHLPHLSVYLCHLDPTTSYWYLSATPELLGTAALRFAQYSGKGVLP
jgi:integrase/recombinase XerD